MGKHITLADAVEEYLEMKMNLKFNTKETYYCLWHAIQNDEIMKTPIRQLKSSQLKTWLADKAKEGKAQTTINSYFTALIKPALQMKYEDDVIKKNPADFKMTSYVKSTKKKTRSLTREEELFLRDCLEDPKYGHRFNREIMLLCLGLGTRPAELAGLTVDDIDFARNEIRIYKQLVNVHGHLHIETPKTESGDRTIPMTDEVRDILTELVRNQNCPTVVDGYSGFLITNRSGAVMSRNTIGHRYTTLVNRLDKDFGTHLSDTSIHSLRHTFCTRLISEGINVRTVQYLMGHKTANVTLDVYSHVVQDQVHSEFGKIKTYFI